MTDNNHPMLPTQEQLTEWDSERFDEGENFDVMMIKAFQAGADQELEACCEWVSQWRCMVGGNRPEIGLRAARRPKPPSLKERALLQLDTLNADLGMHGLGCDLSQIRRALEALPD
jgi:hypothetical protein